MQAYTVYEAPDHPSDRIDRAENLVFVKDGFSWGAFLFAPIWMLVHRLWWCLAGYVGIIIALQLAGTALGHDSRWLSLLGLGLNVILGFEASSLRRWTLERNGWTMVGTAIGRTLAACERSFFDNWLPGQPMIASAQATSAARRPALGGLTQLFGARS